METLRNPKFIYIAICFVSILSLILYLWYSILGFIIGTLALLLLLFCLVSVLSKFLMFPGSFKFWRFWWQSILEHELSSNFLAHLHELKFALELLQKSSNLLHIKKNSTQLQESLEIFNVLINSYKNIPKTDLTPYQINFFDKMTQVFKLLNDTVLIFSDQSENLLNSLACSAEYDWNNVTFEDFPENLALKNSILAFNSLEEFVVNFQNIKFPMKFLQEGIFTNLNILRLILHSTARCEQYWINSEGGEIDCVIVKTEDSIVDTPIIIFCNPNGGLYEYAIYQNNWLEFYLTHGIDFCMWNYRGYGRTKGSSSSQSLRTDVQSVYDFLTKVKMYSRIGVHGESIGGVSAAHLASKNDLSFLFADRTFASLEKLVTSRIPVPKEVFKCITKWSDDTSQQFISSNCYKVLSCDTKDEIIPDGASLKTGVSLAYNCNELDRESLHELLEAILNVCKYTKQFKSNESSVENNKDTYVLVGKESEIIEDEAVTSVAFKIFKGLEVDAGGITLADIKTEEQLKSWVRIIQTWGSFLPIGSNYVGKDKAIQKVRHSIDLMAQVFKDNEFNINPNVIGLCRQARFLKSGLGKVLKCLENFNRSSTEELTIRDDDGNEIYHAGYLIPLNCGHSGRYSEEEKEMVRFHLRQVKFIK